MPTQYGYGYVKGAKEITKFTDLPIPEPGPSELLLKIEAAGLCLSDPHTIIGGPIAPKPPKPMPTKFVMGHEIAGSVYKIGKELAEKPQFKVGSRFALQISQACGACASCRSGDDGNCSDNNQAYGLNEDGGFQQYLLIRNLRTLIPIPDNVSYAEAAVCTDSVLTPFHAIKKVGHKIKPHSKVLVQGCGGLGLNAIQILKQFKCHIVATDLKSDIGSVAKEYGAHEFYTNLNDSKHEPESFDIIFDFVGMQESVDISNKYIKRRGTLSQIGLGRYKFKMPNYTFAYREIEVFYNFGGSSAENLECLNWISKGWIKPNVHFVDFDKLPQAMQDLSNNKVRGRVVFRPNKL
ncbi:Alcohol dehydrogenase GroES-like domain family protein [Candida parapsilosis]|uniref:Alcohol dehydrogenase GroES-like domain family protein n=1 Tax=Candida parapsilosis TaxID=5480 RepID=A0A8X7NQ24_CANPA|nr:Alcohol dehydrogenase GroES-like domain family protein [Candida parapsilosis]KAF6049708.1 Alcohol dehydrogenase GroES-like domain family protein [Candida parapsilosis]KAF6057570.1 Alcohol dehydrogenase GroES-like domain family protein [Candida parapsilosis]KAF6065722.1 Alcohol dehydrogenase GroES-like domain family protein [Candida parapsilosis]